jgi:hypothetical protein
VGWHQRLVRDGFQEGFVSQGTSDLILHPLAHEAKLFNSVLEPLSTATTQKLCSFSGAEFILPWLFPHHITFNGSVLQHTTIGKGIYWIPFALHTSSL